MLSKLVKLLFYLAKNSDGKTGSDMNAQHTSLVLAGVKVAHGIITS